MFPVKRGLFGPCPDYESCQLNPCLFEHDVTTNGAPPSRAVAQKGSTSSTTSSTLKDVPLRSALKKRAGDDSVSTQPAKLTKTTITTTTKLVPAPKPSTSRPVASTSKMPVASASKAISTVASKGETSSNTAKIEPPRITPSGTAHTPHNIRQKLLNALYEEFLTNYSTLPKAAVAGVLAARHAKEQEETILSKSTKATYRNAVISALARLKKRPHPTTEEDTGTLEGDAARLKAREEEWKGRLTRDRVIRFVPDKETLRKFDYVVELPEGPGGDQITEEGNRRKCDRCGTEYTVISELNEADRTACSFHYGRMITEKQGGIRQRVWSCCPTPGAATCSQGPHVFRDSSTEILHSRIGFVPTSDITVTTRSSAALDIIALDCELIYTTSGMSLARLTVVDAFGNVVLDEHIRPQGAPLDLNTRFSGVKEGDLELAQLDVVGVRKALGMLVDEKTIVVGHGLENDLKALRWVHLNVIDTAILFPHPNGGTWRHSLRNLTKDILGKFIQDSDPTLGHSALDDSKAALELLRWKVKEQARLGISE